MVPRQNGMLKCSDIIRTFVKLGQHGFEYYFQGFKKEKKSHPSGCVFVFVFVLVDVRQEMLEEAQRKLMNLLNSTEGKIDK